MTAAKTVRVKVPQKDGEVTIRVGGGEPQTFAVTDGVIAAPDQVAADLLLVNVDGASLVDAKS